MSNDQPIPDPDSSERPTTNQPLNAEPRSRWTPVLGVLAIFAVVALVFVVITVLRYTT